MDNPAQKILNANQIFAEQVFATVISLMESIVI
jgi:hypothetical protein